MAKANRKPIWPFNPDEFWTDPDVLQIRRKGARSFYLALLSRIAQVWPRGVPDDPRIIAELLDYDVRSVRAHLESCRHLLRVKKVRNKNGRDRRRVDRDRRRIDSDRRDIGRDRERIGKDRHRFDRDREGIDKDRDPIDRDHTYEFHSKRVDKKFQEAEKKRLTQSRGGRRGAANRWGSHGPPIPKSPRDEVEDEEEDEEKVEDEEEKEGEEKNHSPKPPRHEGAGRGGQGVVVAGFAGGRSTEPPDPATEPGRGREPPSLDRVRPEDLDDPGRVLELYDQAARRGWFRPSEASRAQVVAVARNVRRARGLANPGAVFASRLRRGDWGWHSDSDEDAVRREPQRSTSEPTAVDWTTVAPEIRRLARGEFGGEKA